MRVMLDTHTLLWMTNDSSALSERARESVSDPDIHLCVSIASLWEIAIKHSLGKLPMECTLSEFLKRDIHGNLIEVLQIDEVHLVTLLTLPHHHRDPFDRMIIAQAIAEDMAIIGTDAAFKAYDVEMIW